ncbi:hypothetical protein DFH27DRAFT_307552 [Peziza echinospora]|nr:hypothetical protein DFH27DRAFT_307552 [Peziza echinospora]
MPEARGIRCNIVDDYSGRCLDEYQDDELDLASSQDDQTCKLPAALNRYLDITGSEGHRFRIDLTDTNGLLSVKARKLEFNGVQVGFYVDGKRSVCDLFTLHPEPHRLSCSLRDFMWWNKGFMMHSPLHFGELRINDDTSSTEKNDARYLGVIYVYLGLCHGYVAPPLQSSNTEPDLPSISKGMHVHESVLKGRDISQCVQLGEPIQSQGIAFEVTEYDHDGPYVAFRFLYRTRKALESLRVIQPLEPSPPSPSHIPECKTEPDSSQYRASQGSADPDAMEIEVLDMTEDAEIDDDGDDELADDTQTRQRGDAPSPPTAPAQRTTELVFRPHPGQGQRGHQF